MLLLVLQEDAVDAVNIVWRTLNQMAADMLERVPFMVIAVIVMIVIWLLSRLVRSLIMAAGNRTRMDVTLARLLTRLTAFAMFILSILIAAVIIFPTFRPVDLVAGLGITSVAIGFAFKDVLQNFFAGLLILWRRPFVVGDAIVVNGFEGTVEEINVRATRIKTYDSERAIIPNGDVYTSAVLVQTAYANRRRKVSVGIGYGDDIEAARQTIQNVLRGTDGVLADPTPMVIVNELAGSSVNLDVYFWIDTSTGPLKIQDSVLTGIKYALDETGVDIPYPHSVVLLQEAPNAGDGDGSGRKSASKG